jgi:hypothetical protein
VGIEALVGSCMLKRYNFKMSNREVEDFKELGHHLMILHPHIVS